MNTELKSNEGVSVEPSNKKFVRKGKRYGEKQHNSVTDGSKPNDPSWYAQSQQLLKDAASLSFANPQGVRVNFEHIKLGSYPIHVLNCITTIGKAVEASDPATVAARQIYSFVRHANSGSTNYEAPDLFMYLLAIGEIYAIHGWMTRLYGTLRHFNGMNRTIPANLIRAYGVNYDDIIQHVADLRLFINLTARKLNSFYVPANLPYFKRKFFIYSQVFTDSNEAKSDIFLFNPAYLLKFDATGNPNGSQLIKEAWPSFGTPITYAQLVTKVNGFFDALLAEEDINIMSGDILKAYGRNIVQISEIAEDYTVVPTFSGEMLAQYHNASIFSYSTMGDTSFDVVQTSSGVIQQSRGLEISSYDLGLGYSNKAYEFPQLLDADADTSPEYVMEATRLKAVAEITVDQTSEKTNIIDCGTEVIIGSDILFLLPNSSAPMSATDVHFAVIEGGSSTDKIIAQTTERMSRIHLRPHLYEVSSTREYTVRVYGELNNFTVIDPTVLYKLNTVALMSLLGVSSGPSILAANPK